MDQHNLDRTRIVMIDKHGISLTSDFRLNWSDTNLPEEHFSIDPRADFPWKILLKTYDRNRQHLIVEVVDYYPPNSDLFGGQQLRQVIKTLEFETLDWHYFASFLSSYKKAALIPYISDSSDVYIPDQNERNYRYKLKVNFKDVRFTQGAINFWSDLPALNEPVELQVDNMHIIPEFEFIKSYFSNALGRKSFDVLVDLSLKDKRIENIRCHSKQIAAIDEKMISTLKSARVLGLKKAPKVVVVDKHLFNADEIFDQYYDEPDANLFHQKPEDILKSLTTMGVVRNRKQLEYLAGRKQLSDQRILISLAPHFGFLFIASGHQKNHFIWELINSHATYVWSFPGSTKLLGNQLKKIEQIIGIIREQGREKYKSSYRTNLTDLTYQFNTVLHRHADRGVVDPFPGWKYRLEELLQ